MNETLSGQLYLRQISDVHLHVAALTGPIQPLHVYIQRPGTQKDKSHRNCSRWQQFLEQEVCTKDLPVVGDIEVKMADVRCIFRQNNVTSELPWGEPEREVWNFVELEFCMNPVEER